MATLYRPERFRALPDDDTLAATVLALEDGGFGVDVVGDLDAARDAVLARIPDGSSVLTNTSVTLRETGIADAVDRGDRYESARAPQSDYALGSVHAVTRDGVLVIVSASGSQLASYVWGAAKIVFVVGAQKVVPDLDAARERVYGYSPRVGKLLEIHEEQPGRIHIVLIRRPVGF